MPSDVLIPEHHHIPRKSLWFGFGAAAVAWGIYGAAWELISAEACKKGNGNLGALSANDVRWVLVGICCVLFSVALYAGYVSFRNWRQLSSGHDLVHDEARLAEHFLAAGGIFISVIFALSIMWAGLPLIMVGICVKAR